MRRVILLADEKDRDPDKRKYFENFCKRVQWVLEREGLECELTTNLDPVIVKSKTHQ